MLDDILPVMEGEGAVGNTARVDAAASLLLSTIAGMCGGYAPVSSWRGGH